MAHWRWVLVEQRTLLLLECREPWAALRCSRGVVPLVQKDRSKSVSSAWPLALSRMFSGFRSLCKQFRRTTVSGRHGSVWLLATHRTGSVSGHMQAVGVEH